MIGCDLAQGKDYCTKYLPQLHSFTVLSIAKDIYLNSVTKLISQLWLADPFAHGHKVNSLLKCFTQYVKHCHRK